MSWVRVVLKLLLILFFVVISLVVFVAIFRFSKLDHVTKLVKANPVVFVVTLVATKAISIAYPPLPGSLLTAGTISIIGWEAAYAIDLIGSTLGVVLAYFLGRRYGNNILLWVLGEKITDKIKSIKVKDRKQIQTAFIMRIAMGGILSDGLAWGASMVGFRFFPFVMGYILSHLLISAPVFYFISKSIEVSSWAIALPAMLLAWLLIFIFKGKYFE
jgi:uncharacterized membrane protein YdjX (TVP38/TMEM64 family)